MRESAIFSGIPITDRVSERSCGLWVVDTRNGRTIAFLKFEDALQEIFAVQALVGKRYPDVINDNNSVIGDSFVLPDEACGAVPEPLRTWSAKPS